VIAGDLHVIKKSNYYASGSVRKPFQTIQAACDRAGPGDTIVIHQGVYRESVLIKNSGEPGNPIRLIAAKDEQPVLDGTNPVVTPWQEASNGIWNTSVAGPFEQVFLEDSMLVEARWPNMEFPGQLWDRECWASAAKGSDKGLLIDPHLARSGIDFAGATAMLNVSHQFWTWTCPVIRHGANKDRFTYDTTKVSGMKDATQHIRYFDDYYYLFGTIGALDMPGEWLFHREGKLLLIPPNNQSPNSSTVRIKRREFGLTLRGVRHVEVEGLRFFGCTFQIVGGHSNKIANCHCRFPSHSRLLVDREGKRTPCTCVTGNRNRIECCSLAFASGTGLSVNGSNNLIYNNLIHDVCWSGSLDYGAIRINGTENTIRRNTVFNSGNLLVSHGNGINVVELNHVYNGGRACRDVSLIYSVTPKAANSIVSHNWVHGCLAPHLAMGVRGDDKSRDLVFHHNVIWDCGWEGLVVKGDRHHVFHNTAFDNGRSDILLYVGPEKDKEWQKRWSALTHQNKNSMILNNAVQSMAGNRQHPEIRPGGVINGNYESDDVKLQLNDPERFDFRPKSDSVLIDCGQLMSENKESFAGKAPDAGAYEYGRDYWIPGITWNPKDVIGAIPKDYIMIPHP
jgi:hypothetical protein